MTFARSLLFNLFFFVSTFVLTVPAAILSIVAPTQIMGWAKFWARTQLSAARIICGIQYEVIDWERMPPPPVLIASRHESTFDVLVWIALLPAACFVVKRELTLIPLFGRCIQAVGMISVDRDAGATALRTLLRGADRAKAEGRHIVIFPEGTRVAPDEHPQLHPGVAAVAARTELLVVPIMTNSGVCWGRRAFRKRPGTIRIVIHPPLAVQHGREALLGTLHAVFDGSKLSDQGVSPK
jgi:1-acyl-sn-glycerol-3-phosphate acyltransferase